MQLCHEFTDIEFESGEYAILKRQTDREELDKKRIGLVTKSRAVTRGRSPWRTRFNEAVLSTGSVIHVRDVLPAVTV